MIPLTFHSQNLTLSNLDALPWYKNTIELAQRNLGRQRVTTTGDAHSLDAIIGLRQYATTNLGQRLSLHKQHAYTCHRTLSPKTIAGVNTIDRAELGTSELETSSIAKGFAYFVLCLRDSAVRSGRVAGVDVLVDLSRVLVLSCTLSSCATNKSD